MSDSRTCDQCSATAYKSEAEDDWFQVIFQGSRSDYCTAVCATAGIESLHAEHVDAAIAAMEDDDS